MADPITQDGLRTRFHELGAQRTQILDASIPLREQRDAYQQEADAQIKLMNEQIKSMEMGLYEIDRERGLIAKALGGKTGEPT